MARRTPASSNGQSRAKLSEMEQRLAALERQVDELKSTAALRPAKDWRRTIGMFAGDEMRKQIMGEALKYRERDRRRRVARARRTGK